MTAQKTCNGALARCPGDAVKVGSVMVKPKRCASCGLVSLVSAKIRTCPRPISLLGIFGLGDPNTVLTDRPAQRLLDD